MAEMPLTFTDYREMKAKIHSQILQEMDLEGVNKLQEDVARTRVCEAIRELLHRDRTPLAFSEREQLVKEVVNELFGLGPIETMLDVLEACVKGKLNIMVSGGTGAGKTTLLNILSSYIPNSERIITIEDAAELRLNQEHIVRLETRPPNIEGKGAIRQRQLVINALRMRPDRIIVGEVRGEEAIDMLQAMNTGHEGSLTTIHANTTRDALSRLETMIAMAELNLPDRAVRQQVASAIHVIVQVTRMPDGSRKITNISEVTGMEGPMITTQDIFVFERSGYDENNRIRGTFQPTGIRPKFIERLESFGLRLDPDTFAEQPLRGGRY